jgi:hypothetical protein
MQCKDFESVLASEGSGPLSAEAREHLGGCSRCQDFLSDIDSIVAAARTLSSEVTPPDRVWISLRAQLEAEGLIKEPAETAARPSWWENLGFFLKPRSLATAGAALLLAVTAVFLTHTSRTTNTVNVPTETSTAKVTGTMGPSAPGGVTNSPSAPANVTAENSAPAPAPVRVKELKPSPSENASTTLSETEVDVSNMRLAGAGNAQVDASLRQNLRTLNEFIAECEQHLRKNPEDELAREYLNIAYQQKADLLAAMMESGRSEH